MSFSTWIDDKTKSFEVGAAGLVDLATGDYFNATATVLSHTDVPAGWTPEQTFVAAKTQVDSGKLLQTAWDRTVDDLTPTVPTWVKVAAVGIIVAVIVIAGAFVMYQYKLIVR